MTEVAKVSFGMMNLASLLPSSLKAGKVVLDEGRQVKNNTPFYGSSWDLGNEDYGKPKKRYSFNTFTSAMTQQTQELEKEVDKKVFKGEGNF